MTTTLLGTDIRATHYSKSRRLQSDVLGHLLHSTTLALSLDSRPKVEVAVLTTPASHPGSRFVWKALTLVALPNLPIPPLLHLGWHRISASSGTALLPFRD